MDWLNLIINVIAIFAGLAIYLVIQNSKWGKEHTQYQYAVMLGAILLACIVGGILRVTVKALFLS